jgi:flagellar biosynthesis protein FlhF
VNLSRFFGSTNREVLRQVRMALGPDALIVSNRRVNGGVEIMAADATSLPAGVQDPDSNKAREPDSNVIEAIGAMRGALETRIDEVLWGSQLRRAPEAVQVIQTMLGCGFSTA